MKKRTKLMETLKIVEQGADGKDITVETMVETLNHRGFGTLLLLPAVLIILPTGMIPGIPALCAVIIFMLAVQMVAGREYPWIPGKIKKLSIRRARYAHAIKKAQPFIHAVDSLTRRRLDFLAGKGWQLVAALFCIILALMIAGLGFIPFVPAVLSIPVLLFALGLSAGDGVFTLAGFVLAFGAVSIIPLMLQIAGG